MTRKNPALIVLALLMTLTLTLTSCKKPENDTGSSPNSSDYETDQETEATLLTNSFIENLETDLLAEGYSQNQADIITEQAESQIYIDEVGQTTDISLIAPCIVKGAQLSLSISTIGLTTSDERLQAIEVILASITSSLDGKISDTSVSMAPESSLSASPGMPLYASSTTYSSVLEQIVAISITYLDDVGIESSDIITAVKAVVKKVSCNLTRAGVSADDLESVAKSITTSAVGALDDAGVSSSDMSDAVKAITSGALTGLKEDGQSTTVIAAVSDDITEGTILGLKEAGVSDSDIDTMVETVKTAVNDGLAEAGLTTQEIDDIQTEIQEAATQGRRGLSLKSILSFEFLADQNPALSDDVTGTIDEVNKTISLTVPYGTDLTALIASFTTTGESVKVENTTQTSGSTANDFRSSVSYVVVDANGEAVQYSVSVTSVDHVLSVSSIAPAADATGVDPNSTVSVTFNYSIDSSTLSSSTVYLKDEANNQIAGSLAVSGSTVTFTPSNKLIYYTYTLTVTSELKDTMDIGLLSNYNSSFTINWVLPDTEWTVSETLTFGEDHDYIGPAMSFTANGDGTVTDNNTNLLWQQTDDATQKIFADAGVYCDGLTLAGFTDWRLPDRKELASLIMGNGAFVKTDPAFTGYQSAYYWTGTIDPTTNDNAIIVDFNTKNSGSAIKTSSHYVRCLRGKQQTNSLFDSGIDTIIDNNTGLEWQKWENGQMNFDSALTTCEGLSLAGKTDWRLPNFKELLSILDPSNTPAVDTSLFPDVQAAEYHSSSASNTTNVLVNFSTAIYRGQSVSLSKYVRCVRGGI